MRLAEAARMADMSLRWGHYHRPPLAWVFCPRCRARVEVELAVARGPRSLQIAERERRLHAALCDHLVDECPGAATCVRRSR